MDLPQPIKDPEIKYKQVLKKIIYTYNLIIHFVFIFYCNGYTHLIFKFIFLIY